METHLTPNAIIALHYLSTRFNATDRQVGKAVGIVSFEAYSLLTTLGTMSLVSFQSGAWSITPSGRIARKLGTV